MKKLCGIDEAGRGPLAGPMVIAGVVLLKKQKRGGGDMNTIFKIVIFTAPIFAVVLFFFLQFHTKFQADYALENYRFEKQFQSVWKNGTLPEKDKWLEMQEKEVEAYWKQGEKASNRTMAAKEEFEKELDALDRGELKFSKEDMEKFKELEKELH